MNKIFTLIVLLLCVHLVFAQEVEKEKTITFSGYVRYDAFFDTYESVSARQGNIYLYPVKQVLNSAGEDIKAYNQLNMLAAASRIRAKINGPEAFGAKINGLVEVDFLGKAGSTAKGDAVDFTQTPRIRHMYMNMTWDRAQLLIGQGWHPIFVTECFPGVLSDGAALPFNPFNRAPQIKYTYKITDKLEVVGAALSHLDMYSKGPANAQKNAVTPDFHGQLKYKTQNLAVGIVGGYKTLKPRTITADSSITTKIIGSYDIQGFIKVKTGNLTLKALGIYGQNLSSFVMIGGYGAAQDPTQVEDFDYSNINTMAIWGEAVYKIDAIELGFFAGYSSILGTDTDNYYDLKYTRSANLDNIMRVSPRISYTMGSILFGLEYMLTTATYMDTNTAEAKFEATKKYDPVANHRIHFQAKYTF